MIRCYLFVAKTNFLLSLRKLLRQSVITLTYTAVTAARAVDFVDSIGVNTHLDFSGSTYNNIKLVESAIEYLGIHNLRDSPESSADLGASGLWQQVANATGAKFDAYIPEGSPVNMTASMGLITTLAGQGILNFVEGPNEEDDPYALSLGNNLASAAAFQKQFYAALHQLGLPVINISFGQGWGSSPTGDYGTVGNLSAYADYANAHTYFGSGNPPQSAINALNSDAGLAAPGKPVITTEMGWYTDGSAIDTSNVSQTVQAKYMLDGLLDAYQAGDAKTYLYELLDQHNKTDSEDNFGLFNADGSAKPAAVALHNLTTLLADGGAGSFAPGSLSYSLSGTLSTDHSLLLEKSDGTYWLALWNESRLSGPSAPTDVVVPNHTVTLTLAGTATSITVYDPMSGTNAVEQIGSAQTAQISLPDHPILVEIAPPSSTPTPISSSGSAAFTPPAVAPDTNPAHQTSVALPAALSVDTGQSLALPNIAISDAWAAGNSGSMALNLGVDHGSLSVAGHTGSSLQFTGSLAQLNADLASLNFSAPTSAGTATLTVNVYNQSGYSITETTPISTMLVVPNADDAAIARLYTAALNRTPDAAGLAFYEGVYADGVSASAKAQGYVSSLGEAGVSGGPLSIAGGFINSAEFSAIYGSLSNDGFVHQLYINALHRAADASGAQFWDNLLDTGAVTRETVLVYFAESPENVHNSASWLMTPA